MNFSKQLVGLAAAALVLGAATASQAAIGTFDFTEGGAAAGFSPASSYGTVTVTENGGGLDFSFTPTSPYRIHDGNANHNAFAFDMDGVAGVVISNITAGFVSLTNVDSPPFGSYGLALDCTTSCGPGYAGGFAGPLTFRVTAGSALTLSSLTFNSVGGKNVYFTADLVNTGGLTGNVGATLTGGGGGVPEPATWGLMILGFGGAGAALRSSRRRKAAAFA
jgi:hypothetical protein